MCLSQIDVPPTSGLQSTFYTEQLKNANSNYPVTWDENEVMQASEIVQAKIDLAGKFATSGCGQKIMEWLFTPNETDRFHKGENSNTQKKTLFQTNEHVCCFRAECNNFCISHPGLHRRR